MEKGSSCLKTPAPQREASGEFCRVRGKCIIRNWGKGQRFPATAGAWAVPPAPLLSHRWRLCAVLSCCYVRLFATTWTVTHQALLSVGFPRQEYWSGLPFPSPGDLPNLGIKPVTQHWQADSLPLSHQGSFPDVNWFCRCPLFAHLLECLSYSY